MPANKRMIGQTLLTTVGVQHIREQRVAHLREQQRQLGSSAAALQGSDAAAPDRRDPAHATAEGAAAVQPDVAALRLAVTSDTPAAAGLPPPNGLHADQDSMPDVAQEQQHLQLLGVLPHMSDAALAATIKVLQQT